MNRNRQPKPRATYRVDVYVEDDIVQRIPCGSMAQATREFVRMNARGAECEIVTVALKVA